MPTRQWPEVTTERRTWTPAASWGVRAARTGQSTQTYESAVTPLITSLTPNPERETAEAAEEAAHELTRFDAELGSRNHSFAPVLLRSEAASSSQIENLTANARAIFTAELGAKTSGNALQIAANTRAMSTAIELSENVSSDSIRSLHRVLMESEPRHVPGEWRQEPVWIGRRGDSPVGAEFVAPHEDRIPALIDDLVTFSRRWDVPAMTSVAVSHAQFETIHPFTDGNGRTGRAFAQSLLRHRGVTMNVAIPVSAGLLADITGYHQALTAYRAGDISPIVHAFAQASMRAVANARQLVAEIDEIRYSWDERVTARRDSNAWRLLDILARRPVLNTAAAAHELGIRQQNVYGPIQALVDAGILTKKSEHKQGPFWRSPEILEALDRFAERAGRRSRS